MAILCEPAATASGLTSGIPGEVRVAESLNDVAALLNADPSETLVVIGPSVSDYDALDFTSELRMARPAVGVVMAREQVDNMLLMVALQAGVREIVPIGDPAALGAACYRSLKVSHRIIDTAPLQQPEPETGGQVITVFAAKGGTGKTTMAINMGIALAMDTGQRVCVLDLDLAFGQVAISVGLDPARTIVDALGMAGRLDTFGVELLLTRYRTGLDMLLAPVNPRDAEKIPATLVRELLTVLRGMFGYVVVDTPPALSEHVLTAMDASDHHVLITTPEVPSLKNLRVAMDTMDLLSYPEEIRTVVLNRADSKVGLNLEHLERVIRCPVSAHIPSSRAVPVSVNKGLPLVLDNPGHAVSKAITRFAQQQLRNAPQRTTARPLALPGAAPDSRDSASIRGAA